MIHFVHIRNTGNVGDLASCPAQYFEFPPHTVGDYEDPVPEGTKVVIYGGGTLTAWAAHRDEKVPFRVLWGTGSTRHGETEPWPDPEGFSMVGIREWSEEREKAINYVPCASCMSPLFGLEYPLKHEAVRFVNASDQIKQRYPMGAADLPTMENAEDLETVLRFLGSGETVVTNSFHGMYWATLLGRRVVCQPYSSKFYNQKFPATLIVNANDWRVYAADTKTWPMALGDCRANNVRFYHQIMNRIGG